MPRFVVLHHRLPQQSGRPSHFDLMLETKGVLRTWALEQPPAPGCTITAQSLANHRLAYLDYEGPVSGDRGDVTRFDRGDYQSIAEEDGRIVVFLAGDRLRGKLELVCENDGTHWSLRFAPAADDA